MVFVMLLQNGKRAVGFGFCLSSVAASDVAEPFPRHDPVRCGVRVPKIEALVGRGRNDVFARVNRFHRLLAAPFAADFFLLCAVQPPGLFFGGTSVRRSSRGGLKR